jgi:hypothetical protein
VTHGNRKDAAIPGSRFLEMHSKYNSYVQHIHTIKDWLRKK